MSAGPAYNRYEWGMSGGKQVAGWKMGLDLPGGAGIYRAGCGAVAQMGERLVRNEEVRGSIPLSSTTILHLQ